MASSSKYASLSKRQKSRHIKKIVSQHMQELNAIASKGFQFQMAMESSFSGNSVQKTCTDSDNATLPGHDIDTYSEEGTARKYSKFAVKDHFGYSAKKYNCEKETASNESKVWLEFSNNLPGLQTQNIPEGAMSSPNGEMVTGQNNELQKAFEMKVLSLLEEIQQDTRDTKLLLQKLLSKEGLTGSLDEKEIDKKSFPLTTSEQMMSLNKELEEEVYLEKMCCWLGLIGGKDAFDCIRRILSKLIANSLAIQYNWKGRGNKKAFSNLKNICKLVIEATKLNPDNEQTSEAEIEGVVKRWLQFAGDRDGGRQKRYTTAPIDEQLE